MELDERKKKILQAVIRNYLETGEPVGSRTISKYTDLNLSSATIRNEMADLEEMGYIFQPHTSAGRIPSDKGYRFYVDAMMEEREREVGEIREMKEMQGRDAAEAGGQSTGTEYTVRHHDIRSPVKTQQTEIYSALPCGCQPASGGDRSGGQCPEEQHSACGGGVG